MFSSCMASGERSPIFPNSSAAVSSPSSAQPSPYNPLHYARPPHLSNNHSADLLHQIALAHDALTTGDSLTAIHLVTELCLNDSSSDGDLQLRWFRQLVAQCVGRAHLLLGDLCKHQFAPVETFLGSFPNEPVGVVVIRHVPKPQLPEDLHAFALALASNLSQPIPMLNAAAPASLGASPPSAPPSSPPEAPRADGLATYPFTFLRLRPRAMAAVFIKDHHAELAMLGEQLQVSDKILHVVDRHRTRRRTYFVKRMDADTVLAVVFPKSILERVEDERIARLFHMCSGFFVDV
jgi:hypothetical protein